MQGVNISSTKIVSIPWLICALLYWPTIVHSDECDQNRGQQLFSKCAICHTHEKTQLHSAGPNLFGIVGRRAGSISGFKFSRAMRSSNIVWTAAELDRFLENPAVTIPRNSMAFSGLKKEQDRKNIICLLLNATGKK